MPPAVVCTERLELGPHVREAERADIGYWVRSDRHRRGYATEAARALTFAAFEHLPSIHAIEILMDRVVW